MIGVVGLNHKSASIEIRERISLSPEQVQAFTQRVKRQESHISEFMVLSTCNRTEFYFYGNACETGNFVLISREITQYFGIPEETIQAHFYHHTGFKAVRHLFGVTAGLDSMVLGEYQIVHQLKQAHQQSKSLRASGKFLTRLFNKALEAGKEVRSTTALSDGAQSVSFVAVDRCAQHFEDLTNREILVVGAGETASLVVKKLEKYACLNITLANRTLEHANAVAGQSIPVIGLEGMDVPLGKADVLITATTAGSLINRNLMQSVMADRPDRPMLMIDLGVPRNIDADVAEIEGIWLMNIDDLEAEMEAIRENRNEAVERAEAIIEDHALEFNDWLKLQNLSPVIQDIRQGLDQLHQEEVEQFGSDLTKAEQETLRRFAAHFSDKYARQLIKNIRKATNNGRRNEFTDLLGDIFKVQ